MSNVNKQAFLVHWRIGVSEVSWTEWDDQFLLKPSLTNIVLSSLESEVKVQLTLDLIWRLVSFFPCFLVWKRPVILSFTCSLQSSHSWTYSRISFGSSRVSSYSRDVLRRSVITRVASGQSESPSHSCMTSAIKATRIDSDVFVLPSTLQMI